MIIFKQAAALSDYLKKQQATGRRIGFVPTMGALHEGHLSLIDTCKKENDLVVCSIFVNPTQFNNPEDFSRYPNTIDLDIAALVRAGASVLFLPSESEIYPAEHIKKHYDLGTLDHILEGKSRPGHFQGVCEVMERLLTLVHPDWLYMGRKDYQQCLVVGRLLQLLQVPTQTSFLPTRREPDGLAMSSRNLRLSEQERHTAPFIYKALNEIKNNWGRQNVERLQANAKHLLQEHGFVVDYVAIADAGTLEPLATPDQPAVALVAASLGKIRLIDNMLLN